MPKKTVTNGQKLGILLPPQQAHLLTLYAPEDVRIIYTRNPP